MDAISFVMKICVITLVLVWGLQYKVGEQTVESHIVGFIETSEVVAPLHKVATGAREVAADGWSYLQGAVASIGKGEDGEGRGSDGNVSNGADGRRAGSKKKRSQSESAETREASTFKWQGQ